AARFHRKRCSPTPAVRPLLERWDEEERLAREAAEEVGLDFEWEEVDEQDGHGIVIDGTAVLSGEEPSVQRTASRSLVTGPAAPSANWRSSGRCWRASTFRPTPTRHCFNSWPSRTNSAIRA